MYGLGFRSRFHALALTSFYNAIFGWFILANCNADVKPLNPIPYTLNRKPQTLNDTVHILLPLPCIPLDDSFRDWCVSCLHKPEFRRFSHGSRLSFSGAYGLSGA